MRHPHHAPQGPAHQRRAPRGAPLREPGGHGEPHREGAGGHVRALGGAPRPRSGQPISIPAARSSTSPRAPRCAWTASTPWASACAELKIGTTRCRCRRARTPAGRYRVAMPSFLIDGGDGYGAIFGNAGKDPARNPSAVPQARGRGLQHRCGVHAHGLRERGCGPCARLSASSSRTARSPPGPVLRAGEHRAP